MRLPRFLLKAINGFYLKSMDEWLHKGFIDLNVEHHYSDKESCCHRCKTPLSRITGYYRQKIQTMPILQYKCFIHLKRRKGYCSNCKKIRAEYLDVEIDTETHNRLVSIQCYVMFAKVLLSDQFKPYNITKNLNLNGFKVPLVLNAEKYYEKIIIRINIFSFNVIIC